MGSCYILEKIQVCSGCFEGTVFLQLVFISDIGSPNYFVANLLNVHLNRHDYYSWQTSLIPDLLLLLFNYVYKCSEPTPRMDGVYPNPLNFLLPPPGENNLYFCGFDSWVSFKSGNMVTLSFFSRDQRSLTLHKSISSSCTWLCSSNVFFPFPPHHSAWDENVNIDRNSSPVTT